MLYVDLSLSLSLSLFVIMWAVIIIVEDPIYFLTEKIPFSYITLHYAYVMW